MRDGESGGSGIPGPRHWSAVTWLIVLNVSVFLVQHLFFMPNARPGDLPPGGVSKDAIFGGHIYTLVTHLFIHGSLWHLAANMLIVFIFGRLLVQLTSPRVMLIIYFAGGIFGALADLGIQWNVPVYLGGASGAAMAVLFAVVTLIPREVFTFLLFFILPVRLSMRQIGLLILTIEGITLFFQIATGTLFNPSPKGHSIAVLAHLGGAFFGWAFVKFGLPLTQARVQSREQEGRWKKRFGTNRVVEADVVEEERGGRSKEKEAPFVSKEVDAILDKISEQGMQSLTDEERRILEKSSKKLSKRMDQR